MKLLLTSSGLDNPKLGAKFLELINKPASEINILFIPTAARTKEEIYYAGVAKEELIDLGIKEDNIITYNLDKKLNSDTLNNLHAIYVCGGNTFHLLYMLRKSGFDKKIKQLIEKGVVYAGISAGSIVAGPDIEIAIPFDVNDVKLKDSRGLGITDKVVSPHYNEKHKDIIDQFKEENKLNVIPIKDKEALLIIDNKSEVIK